VSNYFGDHRNAHNLSEEVDHVLGPTETSYVAVDDDAIEAMVDERQEVAEQLGE